LQKNEGEQQAGDHPLAGEKNKKAPTSRKCMKELGEPKNKRKRSGESQENGTPCANARGGCQTAPIANAMKVEETLETEEGTAKGRSALRKAKREAAAVKREARRKAQKEKRLAAEKKKKDAEETLRERGMRMTKGQQKITTWMSRPEAGRPPKGGRTGIG
jgi:hypothetical protein